jgi:hypothetical protein
MSSAAQQKVQRFLAVAHDFDVVGELIAAQRMQRQFQICIIVFNQ